MRDLFTLLLNDPVYPDSDDDTLKDIRDGALLGRFLVSAERKAVPVSAPHQPSKPPKPAWKVFSRTQKWQLVSQLGAASADIIVGSSNFQMGLERIVWHDCCAKQPH